MVAPVLREWELAEDNERAYFSLLAETPPVDGAAVLISPESHALLINRAMCLHLPADGPALALALARIEQPFLENYIYPSFYLTPASQPPGLRRVLLERGYHTEYRQTVMALDEPERVLSPQWPASNPRGLQVIATAGPAQYQAWCQTFLVGFDVPREMRGVMYEINLRSLRHPAVTGLVGLLDGRPVATTVLYLQGETAGIYAVSTIPRARRRGIAGAMVRQALAVGASKGARLGVLQTAAGGDPERLYRSLGFRDLFVAEVLTHYGLGS